MSFTGCLDQLELFEIGRQQVTVTFDGGMVVSDAGLLPVRQLDRQLGILAEAARRLPDPRSQLCVTHSAEQVLTQQVYQVLAGYPDGNDAQLLRDDPLFKTIVDVDPRSDRPLASGSTINRFQHAYTRREAEKPIEERDVLLEVRRAQTERVTALNEFLVDVFVRTRTEPLTRIIIDLDPTDDPTHGQQQLSLFNGYYEQYQYFPMLIFEGNSGMPLGAWLRPGTMHAGCGATDMLISIVDRLRAHWPQIEISVRGDAGLAVPELYEYCADQGLLYAFGYATNKVLQRRVSEEELAENARLLWWMTGRRPFQMFHTFDDYQAGTWSCTRRIVVKIEITKTGGTNIRYVVTNMAGHTRDVYHGFYTQRGNVPERPIGELKNGLAMDRLSSSRFLANAYKLQMHVLAYLLHALFREANAQTPEVGTMEVGTARARLYKVGALVEATTRRIWFRIADHWPGAKLLSQATQAVHAQGERLLGLWRSRNLFVVGPFDDPQDRHRIAFAPLPLK
jgi:Transposase DDE domain group 1